MSAQLAAGAAIAAAACAAVYMNFASPNPAAAAAEEPKGGGVRGGEIHVDCGASGSSDGGTSSELSRH
eukprot:CAMPEP_0115878974 /NCGR_PEP_ID=MMETSP0287-20121206/27069_1 /TAXON_ID=412157 /ORGANISM="Chrysochromulina rotalis, Strain UIO044" /LENGTH=67 /DNA_ID=CAMNT_0003334645 /DNA_START=526 /DNA_END=729 /DNA_ORIENTATION=-